MSITNKLNQIKNAIYGKDVRGAIHDAIKQVYDDASVNHDNANMEVKMARGTHNTLNDRLDNVDEIQAQTNAQLSKIKTSIDNITLNVKDFGAKGDGVTDDSDAIQSCLDYANFANTNTAVPLNTLKITFPFGMYCISKPLTMRSSAIIDFNHAQLLPLKNLDYMWTFESTKQIPGIELRDMVLHGKGMVKKGLLIRDVAKLEIYKLKSFSFTEHHIYADKNGLSGQAHFNINGAELLGGINPNAGGYSTTNGAIGIELRVTDCMIRDVISRDLNTHIYNVSGINFFEHCHGWNQYNAIMAYSTHFKLNWDAKLSNCYCDTITNAFEVVGDGRYEITNHTMFINKDFYDEANYGAPLLIKGTFANRGNMMSFVNSRFDKNGTNAVISDNQNYAKFVRFIACNSNFNQGDFVVNPVTTIPAPTSNTPWGWSVVKTAYNMVHVLVQGDIEKDIVNANESSTTLFTMPNLTYNTYFSTPIKILVLDYGNRNSCVCYGSIEKNGDVIVNLKNVGFTASSNCKYGINTSYHLTF